MKRSTITSNIVFSLTLLAALFVLPSCGGDTPATTDSPAADSTGETNTETPAGINETVETGVELGRIDTVDNKAYYVGAVLSLSGQYELYGQAIKRGIDLAVEQINERGDVNGKPFKVAYADSGSTAAGARAALRALAEQGVKVIIGPETSDLAEATIPLARGLEVVLISPSASAPGLRNIESGGYFFRICTTDESEADAIAADIARDRRQKWLKRGYNRALVLTKADDTYSYGLLQSFARVSTDYGVSYNLVSFTSEELPASSEEAVDSAKAQEILQAVNNYQIYNEDAGKMGAIVIFGFSNDVEKILRLIKENSGETHRIYASSAVDTSEFLINAIDVYDGLIFPRLFDPNSEDNPAVAEFVEAYKLTYDDQIPGLYAAYGYDSGLLIGGTLITTSNLDQALKDPRNFRLAMNDSDFIGATGSVDFDNQTREVSKLPVLYILSIEKGAMLVKDYEGILLQEKLQQMSQQ